MGEIHALIAFVLDLIALIAVVVALLSKMHKISDGTKCQLRSDMLQIYYHNRERKKIRQYEYENFVLLYDAYKALKGNSFIDKIYSEVKEWEVIT
jgi:hypothetical protein